ncbi:MAG TPA: NAD(P)/FAD-dependent oxidoreductase [Blastocatellia bacterium]|nr:NAD(P)/FAD-dependent oxidoreductase [Blastocatellia bacterium]
MKEQTILPQVVIIGGGFGGLIAAQSLRRARVRVTLIDRTNHHLFQPLLYQVAIAGLSPADIASPIRSILSRQKNVTVLLDEAVSVDLARRTIQLRERSLNYDYLILATGGQTSYFGHDEWERFAPGLKSLNDALEIRHRVLLAFEEAEKESDPERRRRLMTFVVVGGGPTGVEIAGAIAELSRTVLARDFRTIDPRSAEILLLEGGPRILPTFAEDLSISAARQLADLGVRVRVNAKVTNIDERGVYLGDELIGSATVIWGAGVVATPFTRTLGVPLDRAGRVIIEPDLTLPGHPEVFAIGDMALFTHQGGKPLPGVSPVAMQMGRCAARNIQHAIKGEPYETFHYFDKGNMATIGRSRAIAEIGRLKLRGYPAWLAWLFVHLIFLIGFRNRAAVFFNWMWSYLTYQRGARLITEQPAAAQTAEAKKPEAASAREYKAV